MQVVRLELEEEVEVGGSDEHPKQDSKASDIFLLLLGSCSWVGRRGRGCDLEEIESKFLSFPIWAFGFWLMRERGRILYFRK